MSAITYSAQPVSLDFKVYDSANSQETLLCIHGAESTQATCQPILDAGLNNKYKVVTFDLRGHGKSPIGNLDFSLQDIIADIEELVKKLGLLKFVLVAHSMGVRLALPYAAKHPEQVIGVVLEDLELKPRNKPNLKPDEIEKLRNFVKFHTDEKSVRDELAKFGYEERFDSWKQDARIEQLNDGTLSININPYINYLFISRMTSLNIAYEAFVKLNMKNTPVLLLRAEINSCASEIGALEMQKLQPEMKHIFIPGSKHAIHKSHTELFIRYLSEFVSHIKSK